jgi:hypothetical protein
MSPSAAPSRFGSNPSGTVCPPGARTAAPSFPAIQRHVAAIHRTIADNTLATGPAPPPC